MRARSALAWLALLGVTAAFTAPLLAPAVALADGETQAFARVVVDGADLRTGPGVSFRVIYTAHRGETLALDGRPGPGFWLRVLLPDGRAAYVLGEEVQPFAVTKGAEGAPSRPGLFAPPPLEGAHAGLTILGGGISIPVEGLGVRQYGYFEARPQIVVHKTLSIDGFVGISPTADGNQVMYGGGGTVYFAPSWPVCPFLGIGIGRLSVLPTVDSFIKTEQDYFVARAGGGFLLALRGRILMRFEATNVSIFTADSYKNAQTFAGGFGVYF